MNDRSQGSLKPTQWRVRPYESSVWRITDVPPTDETRRWMEFEPITEDAAQGSTVSEANGKP